MFADFMVNTWIAATVVAAAAGVVGFFVVVRGSTFAAHALPLGSFPGAAAAGLLGIHPFFGVLAFSAFGVFGITSLDRGRRPEVATALSLVTLLGFGALFLSMGHGYAQATYALLFGQVLGIGAADLMPLATASAVAIGGVALLFRPLLLSAVSSDLAATRGVRPGRMEVAFLSIVALTTAVALPVVGALLVFTLMVGPASAARAFTVRPGWAAVLSAVIAVLMVWTAIALSFVTDWPVGFFVGSLASVLYAAGRFAFTSRASSSGTARPATPPSAKHPVKSRPRPTVR